MIFGYARVSTYEQNLDLQIDALLKIGISEKNIYTDKVSSAQKERKQLESLLKQLREDDTIVVWKIDRIARSLIDFNKLMNFFIAKKVRFKSITEPFIDTTDTSPHTKFITNIFASLAQFERDLIIERTKAGLISAKNRGKILGRPNGLSEKSLKKAKRCKRFFEEGILTVDEICKEVGVSRATYYKYLRELGVNEIRKYKK
ncbi:MAG: recombinase family protein [Fusobacterium sp.]|nr:recombinase family protein [Fusobacterium sp.]